LPSAFDDCRASRRRSQAEVTGRLRN
jgi:hypothetical protein